MADIFQLFRDKATIVTIQYELDGEPVFLKVDATMSENQELISEITNNPIEDGSLVSDHVVKTPRRYSMEGVVSDSPITIQSAIIGAVAGVPGTLIGGAIGGITTAAVSAIGGILLSTGKGKPSVIALQTLDAIYENSIPLTIVSGLRTWTNMVMVNLAAPRTAQTSGGLFFNATFQELKIVTSEVVAVPPTDTPVPVSKVKKGTQGTDVVGEKTEEKYQSLLTKIRTGAGL